MTTTDHVTTVQLSGHDGLLAAIPSMLGFHPQESLVLVCLTGCRRRVGPVVRVDLTAPMGGTEELAPGVTELRRYALQYADELALVCYTEAPERPELLDRVLAGLLADGSAILDAVVVRGDRAYPAMTGDLLGSGISVPGRQHPQVQAMIAASALEGRTILPDRKALRDSIAGPTGAAARRSSVATRRAADRVLGALGTSGPLNRERLEALRDLNIDRALASAVTSGGVPVQVSALVALMVCDVHIRDHLIARAIRDTDRAWLPMLIAVARATPDVDAAQICAVLALAAYRRGDGALAQVALDRCLTTEPDHRLAHLTMSAMAAGMPPHDLLALTSELPEDDEITEGRA